MKKIFFNGRTTNAGHVSFLTTGLLLATLVVAAPSALAIGFLADLSISKTASSNPITAGNNLTYTLTVANAGPDTASNVAVTDVLPSCVTVVSTTGCTESPAGTLTCSLVAIASGGTSSFTVEVNTSSCLAGTITNSATVASSTLDPNPANDSVSLNTTVVTSADLSISKTASSNPITAGNNLTYTLTVANAGPDTASNVAVTDVLPSCVTVVSAAGCTESPAGTLTCNLGTIASGGTPSFPVTVNTSSCPAGTITNTATVASSTADPTPGNNSTSLPTTVTHLPVSYTGTTATGGSATAIVSNGGATCGFTSSQFVPLSGNAPSGVSFPHGLFNFTLGNCTSGGTVTLNITYSSAVSAGMRYWKYGSTPDNASPHWYTIPAAISGNTMTFSITDGGIGDDGWISGSDGIIVDAGGPGLVTPIPTLSEWGVILLAGMLGVFGIGMMRRSMAG